MNSQPILNLLDSLTHVWRRWFSEDADCLEGRHDF